MKKRALITGVGGQDGSYLAELLLSKDYEIDPIFYRAAEIMDFRADASKAFDKLGWRAKTRLPELVRIMCEKSD